MDDVNYYATKIETKRQIRIDIWKTARPASSTPYFCYKSWNAVNKKINKNRKNVNIVFRSASELRFQVSQ